MNGAVGAALDMLTRRHYIGTKAATDKSAAASNKNLLYFMPTLDFTQNKGLTPAIDEFSRLCYLAAYNEQSTYSSADFLKKTYAFFKHNGFTMACVQTDNGFAFTNRFALSSRDCMTLFEKTAADPGIRHKLIRPYTPRHNGKVERSHREDQRRFYDTHAFYSLADFDAQLAVHRRASNNRPMRPLQYNSPNVFLRSHTVQHV